MNKTVKKALSAILTLFLVTLPVCSVFASAATQEEVMPLYNNVSKAELDASISSSGKMTITYSYTGSSSVTTKAEVTIYIEKKTLGMFWSRVDIGTTDNEWVQIIYNYKYSGTKTFQLSASGTYRVTAKFKISGTGGSADEIKKQVKVSY